METNLNAKYELLHNEASDVCLGHDVFNGASMECKVIIQPYHACLHGHVLAFDGHDLF